MEVNAIISGISGLIGVIVGSSISYMFNKKFLKHNLFTERQFRLYNSLWESLIELKNSMNELWDLANKKNVLAFSSTLRKVLGDIEKNRLVLSEIDYNNLQEILSLKNFEMGKKKLIELRNSDDIPLDRANELIKDNLDNKESFERLLDKLYNGFKKVVS